MNMYLQLTSFFYKAITHVIQILVQDKNFLDYIVNIMASDDMTTQGTGASTTMI